MEAGRSRIGITSEPVVAPFIAAPSVAKGVLVGSKTAPQVFKLIAEERPC